MRILSKSKDPLAHLEDIASLIAQEHLKHAGETAKETLGIKGRGRVHPLGCRIAIDVGGGEEGLVNVSSDSTDATGIVPLRCPLMQAARPSISGLRNNFSRSGFQESFTWHPGAGTR